MERPTIRARVITVETMRGMRILRENPVVRSWAGEMVEITVASAELNARHELMVEAVSCRGETRIVRIAVFTNLTAQDMERLYTAAIDRISDVSAALKRQMARATGIPTRRDDDFAPPA